MRPNAKPSRMATPSFMTRSDQLAAVRPALDLFAPAKVNLYLEVTGIRDDGYHLIDSLVVFANVGDRLSLAAADTFSFSVSGPFASMAPGDDTNLAVRALRLMERALGRSFPVRMRLEKCLPAGAGLGGGSADAAAVLKGIRALYDLPMTDGELATLGLQLGADLPVCLAGTPVRASGVGEVITPFAGCSPLATVLVFPGAGLDTPAVYRKYDEYHSNAEIAPPRPMTSDMDFENLANRRNDLEAAAISLQPAVGEVLDGLRASPGCRLARMSGSGSACFGIFDTAAEASAAAEHLGQAQPGWWVRPVELGGDA